MKIIKSLSLFSLMLVSSTVLAMDMSDWAKYADNLQSCSPGTFNLPDPIRANVAGVSPVTTYQIIGMKDGKCEINITKTYTQPGQTQPTSLVLNCAITSENLSVVSKSAKDISTGGSTSSDDAAAKIMTNSCKQAP